MRKTKKVMPAGDAPEVFSRCARRLHKMAEDVRGFDIRSQDIRAGLLHLADLYENCPSYYPSVAIRQSDGIPLLTSYSVTSGMGSPAGMCSE